MNTILIAEDEKFIRRGIRVMAQRAPVPVGEILEARDGAEALELLRTHTVDLLITDIRMPHMDGVELVSQLDTLPHRPLVLVVSGYGDFNYAVAMMRGGAQDYLLKPVEREKFYEALQKMEALLAQEENARRSDNQRALHALRYLMLDSNMRGSERAELLAQYGSQFFTGPYLGFCSAGAGEQGVLPDTALQLHTIGALSLFVLPAASAGQAAAALQAPVGVSTTKTGLAALHDCYTEALAAWKQAFFVRGAHPLCRAGELPAPDGQAKTTVKQLVGLVGLSRPGEITRLLTAEARRVEEEALAPDCFAALCAAFVKELHETYQNLIETGDELGRFGDLWAFADVRTYLEELDGWLGGFCARMAQEFADYENKQKIRQAVQYIQQNFAKPLNMTLVSNEVSMNYSLFSLLFKQYTGTNFVSYLQRLRLEEAQRLLTTTDWKVNEIGRRVGFVDDKHFLKVFKSAVGLSPTEYRRAAATQGMPDARPAPPAGEPR